MTVSSVKTGYDGISLLVGNAAYQPLGSRGVFMGGTGVSTNTIDYIDIATTGNATDFGDQTAATESNAGASSQTRGLSAGGEISGGSPRSNIIEYITIASAGNATDFGDLVAGAYWPAGTSNNIRALFGGGTESSGTVSARMTYVTIATTGNATNFGDLVTSNSRTRGMGSAASSTRALFAGACGASTTYQADIEYYTIDTTGTSTTFGDLTVARGFMSGGASSGTRALFAGGETANNVFTNTIDYVTIASTGNATDFGDLTYSAQAGVTSTVTRAVLPRTSGSVNNMDYVTISTTGNGTDFGDLTVARQNGMACVSNGHGGLA
jgi:hypothetical protein